MKWTEEAVYAPAFADLAETKGAETEKVLFCLFHILLFVKGNLHIIPNPNLLQFSLMENDYVWGDRKVRSCSLRNMLDF